MDCTHKEKKYWFPFLLIQDILALGNLCSPQFVVIIWGAANFTVGRDLTGVEDLYGEYEK